MPERNDPSTRSGTWLLDLFTALRGAGLVLGVDEYRLALTALQAGFGLSDEMALRRLLSALWVKDQADQRVFDLHFQPLFGLGAAEGGSTEQSRTVSDAVEDHDPE